MATIWKRPQKINAIAIIVRLLKMPFFWLVSFSNKIKVWLIFHYDQILSFAFEWLSKRTRRRMDLWRCKSWMLIKLSFRNRAPLTECSLTRNRRAHQLKLLEKGNQTRILCVESKYRSSNCYCYCCYYWSWQNWFSFTFDRWHYRHFFRANHFLLRLVVGLKGCLWGSLFMYVLNPIVCTLDWVNKR